MIEKVKLGDKIELQRGYDLTHENMRDGQYPVVGSTSIIGWHDEYKAEDGITVGRSGTVGLPQLINGKYWPHNTSLFTTDLKGNDREYLYYLLINLHIDKMKTGSNIPTLNRNDIYPLQVLFETDVREQRKVSHILSTLDSIIANNNDVCADLEGMAKLLYDYWFVQFDFPDENGKPYKSSGGKMIWNEELKRKIPVGWIVSPLNNCVSTIIDHRGKTPKKMGGDWAESGKGVMALSAKIIKGNRLQNLEDANWVSEEMYQAWMTDELKDGDILMTSEAPLGEFYYLKGITKYCLSQRLFAIRAEKTTIRPSYLFMYLSKGLGYPLIIKRQSGSTVFGIRQDELRMVDIIIPPVELQDEYCKFADKLFSHIRNLEAENQDLASLRDFLLPMLMNGQVKVKKGENQ